MSEKIKNISAFSTPMGLYEFNYMPFGLVNNICQVFIVTSALLHGIKKTATYKEDMCMHADNFDDEILT